MSIKEIAEKVKSEIARFYTPILLLVVASIFFALGRISALEEQKTPVRIFYPNGSQTGSTINSLSQSAGIGGGQTGANPASGQGSEQVIGSKSGKKYYFPWCGTVKMIKPENQVTFASIADARSAGYVPGGNCKGLK
ncbi:MAG: hypothetical protein WCK48_00780 [bacterium]